MLNWQIGCSGFHYKHWKGSFYPEGLAQSKWFDYYCKYFSTLELNVTFYRFPQLSFLQNWHKKSPENFRFAVKAPCAITHFKKFVGAEQFISDFYLTVRNGLEEKLACVLFQLPPNYSFTEERLDRIVNSLDSAFTNVLEFRDASWWSEDVYTKLASKNISFCGMSHPELPKDIIANTPFLYYRMHGEGQLYASNYEEQQLQHLANEIKRKEILENAYIFFNNDIHTFAVYNARTMGSLPGLNTLTGEL